MSICSLDSLVIFAVLLHRGQVLKERIYFSGSKFFAVRVDPI